VEIRTRHGKLYSQKLDGFRGEAEYPLSRKEIEAKFLDLASGVIGEPKAKKVIAFIPGLEKKDSIKELGSLLRKGGK
jgi:hypothetical protein